MVDAYDKGDLLRVTATFRNLDDALIDPDTVTFKAKKPDGSVSTGPGIRDSVGVFHFDWDLTEPGSWYLRVESTGIGQAAEETAIRVKESAFS